MQKRGNITIYTARFIKPYRDPVYKFTGSRLGFMIWTIYKKLISQGKGEFLPISLDLMSFFPFNLLKLETLQPTQNLKIVN